jgi:hypothetical protein
MQKLKRSLFFSVAADLALRLGPDSERSGTKVCKKYETLWLHQRGKLWKTQHNNTPTATTRKSPRPDLRFVSRENSETTQNGAGATPNKKPYKSMELPPTR